MSLIRTAIASEMSDRYDEFRSDQRTAQPEPLSGSEPARRIRRVRITVTVTVTPLE